MRPEEIDLGEEVVEVERRPRAGVVISVRLSAEEADELQRLADQRETTLSKVAREALGAYLMHGPERGPSAGPWTGTVSSSPVGGHFELRYTAHGFSAETIGAVQEATLAH